MFFRRFMKFYIAAVLTLTVFILGTVMTMGVLIARAQDATAVFPTVESFPTVFQEPVTIEPTLTPTPVIVQDPPPNPIPTDDPTEPPATTPETLLGQLYALLKDGTYMLWAAAGVVVIVGALKTLGSVIGLRIEGNGAVILTLIVQVLIWLGYAAANYFGQGETFKAWYLQIVDAVRSLLPLFGAIFLGHIGFQAAAARNVPVIGYTVPYKSVEKSAKLASAGEGNDWTKPKQ